MHTNSVTYIEYETITKTITKSCFRSCTHMVNGVGIRAAEEAKGKKVERAKGGAELLKRRSSRFLKFFHATTGLKKIRSLFAR